MVDTERTKDNKQLQWYKLLTGKRSNTSSGPKILPEQETQHIQLQLESEFDSSLSVENHLLYEALLSERFLDFVCPVEFQ